MYLKDNENTKHVAIIGMVGRFPGASNVDELWRKLYEGSETITFFHDDEMDSSINSELRNNPNYIRARGVLKDADKFDARFFGMSPRQAEITDPQQRIFLEAAWEALENSGYNPDFFNGSIGVYAGMGNPGCSYYINNILANRNIVDAVGEFQALLANEKDYLATRVSYKLNLKGPSININTACSTSLVAVCQAFYALNSYQCDMAIAGGICIMCPQNSGYLYQRGEILSADGHCRPFDSGANGTVFGSGVGIVVLKRLDDALIDRDHILAVIRGVGINNDGSGKLSYTAPSAEGQAEAIRMAMANANVLPETISYIETHGTGTFLGDPIEILGLTQAFRHKTAKKDFCAIGSIKGNIGHLDAAAGIASLIKCVLSFKHQMLPPSINIENPNPKIDFENSPFYVNDKLSKWESAASPRRAGVSSFGVGGTNAHVILEEAPCKEETDSYRPYQLLLISAKTSTALDSAAINLSNYLKQHPILNLADVAYTLQMGRKVFKHRRMAICKDLNDAVNVLDATDSKLALTSYHEAAERDVVFLFSGQGSQYVNMGLELYRTESIFQKHVDYCSEYLKNHLSFDLRDILYPVEKDVEESEHLLEQTFITQPALFVFEYALAKLWMAWGIHPEALVGHSIGEYVAACLAGVFSLEDALSLVAVRGRLMQELPGGSMSAVFLSEKEIQSFLNENLSLAAINGPSICTVSGNDEAIEDLEKQLSKKSVNYSRLHTSHAFHSKMMDPILEKYTEQVKQISLNPPKIPFLSNVTGTWIASNEVMDPEYWARHLRYTVRFADCLSELLKETSRVFLEVGSGNTLNTLLRQHPDKLPEQFVVSSIRHPQERKSDVAYILNTLGQIWNAGVNVDWRGFYGDEKRYRIPLPTYPFERERHWIEAGSKKYTAGIAATLQSEENNTITPPGEIPKDGDLENECDTIQNKTEKTITKIWMQVLGFKKIGINENYFDLGGNSLMAVRMFTQIEKIFGIKLPLATLYKAPTIKQLSDIVGQRDYVASWSSLVEIQTSGSRLPFFCIHAEGGNVLEYRALAKHIGNGRPFYGIQARGLEGKKIVNATLEEMAADYIKDIKTVQSKGPYYIGGYCLGGLVAFEMAHQLQNNGEEVAFLTLISTSTPDHLRKLIPNLSVFQRIVCRALNRIELELDNLSVLSYKNKLIYILDRIKRLKLKLQFRSEDLVDKLFTFLNLKYKWHAHRYNLQKSVELSNKAYMEYEPKPIQNQAFLFRVSRQNRELLFDPTIGWQNLPEHGLHVYEVNGFHKNILKEPNVRGLAEKLAELLIEVQAR